MMDQLRKYAGQAREYATRLTEQAGQQADLLHSKWHTSLLSTRMEDFQRESTLYVRSHRRGFLAWASGIGATIATAVVLTHLPSRNQDNFASSLTTPDSITPTATSSDSAPNPHTDETLPPLNTKNAEHLSIQELLSDPVKYFQKGDRYYVLSDEALYPDATTHSSGTSGTTDFNLAQVTYKPDNSQKDYTASDAIMGVLSSYTQLPQGSTSVPFLLAFTTDQESIMAIVADAQRVKELKSLYIRLVWLDHLDIAQNSQVASLQNFPRVLAQIVHSESA